MCIFFFFFFKVSVKTLFSHFKFSICHSFNSICFGCVPALLCIPFYLPQDKRTTPPDTRSVPQMQESLPSPPLRLPSRQNHPTVFQTPNNYGNPHGNRWGFVFFFLAQHNIKASSIQHHDIVWKLTPMSPHCLRSYITPVVKTVLEAPSSEVALHRAGPVQQPFTPMNQTPCFQTPQVQYCPPNHWFLFLVLFQQWKTNLCFHYSMNPKLC